MPRSAAKRALRAVLGDPIALEPTDSAQERALLRLMATLGLPKPLVNQHVGTEKCDFVWPAQRLILEWDGPHHRTVVQQRRDRRRDAYVHARGWRMTRIEFDTPHEKVVQRLLSLGFPA